MKEIVRASIEDCSQIERFRLVTRLGNAILSNGGEVFRDGVCGAGAAS